MIHRIPVLKLSFLLALAGALGSLYFSEIAGHAPCVLCWYQRIALYPLVAIYFVALWTEDEKYPRYSLPLATIGFLLASYHNLLYYGVIPEDISPCTGSGNSCTQKQVELFGFVTIPLMAWVSFGLLIASDVLKLEQGKKTL